MLQCTIERSIRYCMYGHTYISCSVVAACSQPLLPLCAQYNTVPGSDEEMEWGLASDASAASDVGELFGAHC